MAETAPGKGKRRLIKLPEAVRRWCLNSQEAYAAGLLEQERCKRRAVERAAK